MSNEYTKINSGLIKIAYLCLCTIQTLRISKQRGYSSAKHLKWTDLSFYWNPHEECLYSELNDNDSLVGGCVIY